MAGSADDQPPPPREIEEGEVVSGYQGEVLSGYHAGSGSDTDTDDEDARYYLQSRHDNDEWVNNVSAAGSGARGNSPLGSFGSDWTVSDVHAGHAGAVTVAPAGDLPRFPCGVCGREFHSSKAVHGHMKVHAMAAKAEKQVAAAAGVGGGVEEVGDSVSVSTAVVLAALPRLFDDTITPVQCASACSNNPVVDGGSGGSSARSSVEPSPTGQSMANVVAAPPAAALEQGPVAPPPGPPQQATLVAPLAAAPQHLHPLQLHTIVRSDPSTWRVAPVGNSQRVFSCSECNRWFPTHQGLGGHVAGHKNRRIAAAAAAAAAAGIDLEEHMACRGGARPARTHACKVCGDVYPSGVSLGGHMRKHYSGKPIVPRKRLRLGIPELALGQPVQGAAPPAMELALGHPVQGAAASAMENPIVAQPLAWYQQAPVVAEPPQAPAVPGTVRLFGVNIGQQAKKDEEEEEEEPRDVDESMNEQ